MWSRVLLIVVGIFAALFGLGVMSMPLVMVDLVGNEDSLVWPLTVAYCGIIAMLLVFYFTLSEKTALFVACASIYAAICASLMLLLWRGSHILQSRMALADEAFVYGGMVVLGAGFIFWLLWHAKISRSNPQPG